MPLLPQIWQFRDKKNTITKDKKYQCILPCSLFSIWASFWSFEDKEEKLPSQIILQDVLRKEKNQFWQEPWNLGFIHYQFGTINRINKDLRMPTSKSTDFTNYNPWAIFPLAPVWLRLLSTVISASNKNLQANNKNCFHIEVQQYFKNINNCLYVFDGNFLAVIWTLNMFHLKSK